jgi:hypothetical protein
MNKLNFIAMFCLLAGACTTTVENPKVDQHSNGDSSQVTCVKDCDDTETHCVASCNANSCEATCHTDHDSCVADCKVSVKVDAGN